MRLFKTLCVALLMLLPVEASAAPKSTTKYTYYTVDGSSAGQILLSMTRRGPRLGGVNAFATTQASFAQSGRMFSNGRTCKVDRIQFIGRYTVKLPRHRAESNIGKALSAWNQFESFVKVHEDKHVSIWNDCIGDMERQARFVTAPTCKGVERKLQQIAERTRQQCNRRHAALDARDQRAIPAQPLVRAALNQGVVSVKRSRKRR